LILRELFAGSAHFNEIRRGLPLISATLLAQRLRALERLGVVSSVNAPGQRRAVYRPTAAGAEFKPLIQGLGEWGQRWAARFEPQNLDAEFLMWNVRRRVAPDRMPAQRVVMRFEFSGLPAGYRRARVFWLVSERGEIDLCLKDPGAEVDLEVSADVRSFARMWLGDLDFSEAVRKGGIRVAGRRELVRAFPVWLLRSQFAAVARPVIGKRER
jgi:DNA-binding HxlR family transcriptional regulator